MANNKGHLDSLNILLVDDDRDCRQFLATSLQEHGAHVRQTGDAETALALMDAEDLDAVVTDKNLPGMSGIELLGKIRESYGDLPLILITGFGSVVSAVDALKMGAQDYLTKPLEAPDRLVTALIKAVDHHRLKLRHSDLQKRLAQAEKMESIGNLAGGVAHELNNILSPIVTLPDVINMQIDEARNSGTADFAAITEFLQLIKTAGKTAAAVVSDLLTSSTQGNYQKTPESLNDIVNECVSSQEILDLKTSAPDISINTSLQDGIPKIICSRFHLNRVTTNLIRNGFEAIMEVHSNPSSFSVVASPASGSLAITTAHATLSEPLMGYEVVKPGNYVILKVTDTGSGINSRDLGRIFEPFYTSKKRTSQSGSGLGLSVVHGVVKDHGGYIDITSAPDQGTTFSLYFPVAETAGVTMEIPAAEQGGTERVLVVDDSPIQRVLAEKILTKLGYEVTTAPNGREALRLFKEAKDANREQPFDVIILDMIMEEDFDGLTTYESISELYPCPATLVLTAYADTERVETLMELGTSLLMKPYESQELAKAIRETLDKERGEGQT